MCDLTTVDYQKGDVVWVKLGSLWWPGLVHDYDSLPEDIKADTQAFKKQPIAYVKFFQEENYEYVKDHNSIYHYNCLKKNEFIKKGLDMMRSTRISTSNMQMFPGDVITAENLTQGDPKILDRPEFSSEEAGKVVYEELFSSPSGKKLKKKKDGKDGSPVVGFLKLDPRRKSMPSKLGRTPKAIPQERLLNLSEDAAAKGYASRELIQPLSSNGNLEKNFSCVDCNYQCSRVNVMLLHYKTHSRHFDHKIKYPAGFKRKKRYANSGTSGVSKKIKLTNGGDHKGKSKAELLEQQKLEAEKLKQNFLMDWEEEENEENEEADDSTERAMSKEEEKVSCFDFDEEEEASSSSMSFTTRKRQYSKSEDKDTGSGKEVKANGKDAKTDLVDEVEALLNETQVPTLPDIPSSKGGDAITLPPPPEVGAGFGTLNSDLNDSLDFRNEIVSKVCSTPAVTSPGKLSKQTLKTNYFKKVREEIAEVAKFEEDEEKQEEEFEDDDMGDENETEATRKALDDIVENVKVTDEETTKQTESIAEKPDVVEEPVKSKPVEEKTVPEKVKPPKETQNNVHVTPEKPTQSKPQPEKIEAKPVEKVIDKPNLVQIGNQTIHIPSRRNSKTEVKKPSNAKTESGSKTEEDRLTEMMLVEEVDLGNPPLYVSKPQHTSTVHIDMSPTEKKNFTLDKSRGSLKTITTKVPIESIRPKYKPMNIPSIPTRQVVASEVTKPVEEKFFILPNNQRIKTPSPVKSPAKSKIMLSSPDGGKIILTEQQAVELRQKGMFSIPPSTSASTAGHTSKSPASKNQQVVYVSQTAAKNVPKSSNVPLITMKSTQKKLNLPVPGLMKINTGKTVIKPEVPASKTIKVEPKVKTQTSLQSKIKTIAHSNASRPEPHPKSTSGQGSILVNQSTLPSILQQRRSTQQPRAQPPALIPQPKVVQEQELISEISNIPGADSSDSVVYLINNQQSQQILINSPASMPGPSTSDSQTIFIDPSTTDLSNIYLTIDDDGNILNIVQKTDEVMTSAPQHSDILAKALADTQVLQAECAVVGDPNYQSPLVNNTYETSLTLNQAPIMSTSEAPTQLQQSSFYSNTNAGAPLLEIKPDQDNVVGMASPEIAYTPSDIIQT
ncbi:hypothetical protein M8J76_007029 [Diaphorina citri]|nr:hypothetical protein M8J75_000122 [Diaphorina citri]KAI5722343.1 hypothetical protein M8J76_007029 [Diaphorina citri]